MGIPIPNQPPSEDKQLGAPVEEALEEEVLTAEDIAHMIAAVARGMGRSTKHREKIDRTTLRELAAWEREITSNYGVER